MNINNIAPTILIMGAMHLYIKQLLHCYIKQESEHLAQ